MSRDLEVDKMIEMEADGYDEFIKLRGKDKSFAGQYKNTAEDFTEWYNDVYLANR